MLAEECALLNEDEDINRLASVYNNIGNIYSQKLDYSNALNYYEQSLSYFNKDQVKAQNRIDRLNYNIANIYYITYEYEKALTIINDNINYANLDDKKSLYELRANIFQVQENLSEARKRRHRQESRENSP